MTCSGYDVFSTMRSHSTPPAAEELAAAVPSRREENTRTASSRKKEARCYFHSAPILSSLGSARYTAKADRPHNSREHIIRLHHGKKASSWCTALLPVHSKQRIRCHGRRSFTGGGGDARVNDAPNNWRSIPSLSLSLSLVSTSNRPASPLYCQQCPTRLRLTVVTSDLWMCRGLVANH
jgi:hypothetical protein